MEHPPVLYLHFIPQELWLACWILCSSRQQRRLSLVCQIFRSLCLPLLLEHQRFDITSLESRLNPTNWIDRVRHLHRTAVRLDRLAEEPRVLLVRSWKVRATWTGGIMALPNSHPNIQNIDLFETVHERVRTTFLVTLSLYQHLCTLHIEGLDIDASFRNTLASLPMLDSLTVCRCHIVAHDGFLKLGRFTQLVPTDSWVVIQTQSTENPFQLPSPYSLRVLDIQDADGITPLIRGFGLRQLPELVDITLATLYSVGVFFDFLKQCPRLESLRITAIPAQFLPSLPKYISPETIPGLRTLAGSPLLIRLLVPNRPVSAVTILGMQDTGGVSREELMDVVAQSAQAAAPLRSLVVPPTSLTLDSMTDMISLFPELRELTMVISGNMFPGTRGRDGASARWYNIGAPSIELNDDDAFDDVPAEEVSDGEEEDPPRIVRAVTLPQPVTPETLRFSKLLVRI
jgi:hypothetical protein